jgi:hypothetical protein
MQFIVVHRVRYGAFFELGNSRHIALRRGHTRWHTRCSARGQFEMIAAFFLEASRGCTGTGTLELYGVAGVSSSHSRLNSWPLPCHFTARVRSEG